MLPKFLSNKSTLTNTTAAGLLGFSYLAPTANDMLFSMGAFALSGAVTNWLAIHMLFEKIPGLYGSGIIPNRFNEFKTGIRQLIMDQFFTKENIDKFLGSSEVLSGEQNLDPTPLLDAIDFDSVFEKLVEAIESSPFGGMLAAFGGKEALMPLKPTIEAKLREAIADIAKSPAVTNALHSLVSKGLISDSILAKVDSIVSQRLDELTPQMVKTIIQQMIRDHLGWLVVWGGVFGAVMGLIAYLIAG